MTDLVTVDFVVDTERPTDAAARERLLDRAMGPGRVKKTCERLRDGRLPADGLALVARDATGRVIGTVRLWHVGAGGRAALMLGPLAVHPWWQGRGVGGALLRTALARAAALGHGAVLLVGDAPYYARFGFTPALTAALDLPGPVDRARFLGLELVPGAFAGLSGCLAASGAVAPAARLPRRRALTTPARRVS